MVQLLNAYGGCEIVSSNSRVYGNGYGKLEVSSLGEALFADGGSERGLSNGITGVEVVGKLEGFPLGELLCADSGSAIVAYSDRSYRKGDVKIE